MKIVIDRLGQPNFLYKKVIRSYPTLCQSVVSIRDLVADVGGVKNRLSAIASESDARVFAVVALS